MMNKGFSLTEIMIVIGLLLILFAFASINLIGSISRSQESQITDVLISDLRAQQINALTGKGEGWGIDFSTTAYTLTPENFVVNLPEGYVFTTTPSIIFTKGTGETIDTTISLEAIQSGDVKLININKYGATY